MPSSPTNSDPWVHRILATAKPKSALDIGIGCGRFGFLFREKCEPRDTPSFFYPQNWRCRLDGIEAFKAYIGDVQQMLYDKIYIGDAYEIIDNLQDKYDIVHLGDVLEHFPKERGLNFVQKCYQKSLKGVIIVTPFKPEEQGAKWDNEYEIHRGAFSQRDFNKYPYRLSKIVGGRIWPRRTVIYLSRSPFIVSRWGATTGFPAIQHVRMRTIETIRKLKRGIS